MEQNQPLKSAENSIDVTISTNVDLKTYILFFFLYMKVRLRKNSTLTDVYTSIFPFCCRVTCIPIFFHTRIFRVDLRNIRNKHIFAWNNYIQ